MSALTIRLPDSLHRHLRNVAAADGISVNQFISLAVAEKLSALQTYDLIAQRASRSSREAFLEAMAAVPDVPPLPGDELPDGFKGEQDAGGNGGNAG
jgi:hypothetical protein